MIETKRYSLVRPTVDTPYSIDFGWWRQHDSKWRVHLRSTLCPEHKEQFMDVEAGEVVDWVDPETAKVHRVDGLQHILISHCAKTEGFITSRTSLVESIFRLFLANGNTRLTPQELGERLNRPAMTILRMLSGSQVYKGIRPCIVNK
ncbi:MAG: hypothetical protein U9Q82_04355 [Chloroflexota bacterium]|nr:hypothetical protein [Chloroflexota bacterium]